MRLLHKFFLRSREDRVLLIRALVLVFCVRVGLRLLAFRTVRRLVDHPLVARPDGDPREAWMYQRRVVASVEAVGRRLLGDKPCLTQALVARRMLRQGGVDAELRIGVTKDGATLLAHAWLEQEGHVVIGGQASLVRYKPLAAVGTEPV